MTKKRKTQAQRLEEAELRLEESELRLKRLEGVFATLSVMPETMKAFENQVVIIMQSLRAIGADPEAMTEEELEEAKRMILENQESTGESAEPEAVDAR